MARGNYYYDTRNFTVYTALEIAQLPKDIKDHLTMAKEGFVILDSMGKPFIPNSTIKDIKYQQDTERIIDVVNQHHYEAKKKTEEKGKVQYEEDKKAEYAAKLQRMKEASLREREEFIIEVKETLSAVGRVVLKVAIVTGVLVATYAFITMIRATNAVDIEFGVKVIDSAGTRFFPNGAPTNADYNAEFWHQVGQDIDYIIGLFGGK